MKHCNDCTSSWVEFAPQVYNHVLKQQTNYKIRRKPAGSSIPKTVNEMLREHERLVASEPVVLIKNGEYFAVREISETERTRIVNALNLKTKWNKV